MKKKILMIHQGYELYGSDKMFIQSVMALKLKNIEIDICLPKNGLLYDFFLENGFNVSTKRLSV